MAQYTFTPNAENAAFDDAPVVSADGAEAADIPVRDLIVAIQQLVDRIADLDARVTALEPGE